MRALIFFAAAFLVAFSISAQSTSQDNIPNEQEIFATGKRLAECSAFFLFASQVSTSAGKTAAAEHLKNLYNGWQTAGAFFLITGAQRSEFNGPEQAKFIAEARLTQLNARVEIGGASSFSILSKEHDKDCEPLREMQEQTIELLRRKVSGK